MEYTMTAVIFDLDGTLVDSAAALRDIANSYMTRRGLSLLSLEEARSYIGNGAPVLLERALKARNAHDPANFDAHFEEFHQIYSDAPGAANVPFPGVEDTLRHLLAQGYKLGLCTNKPAAPTRVVLEAHGWHEFMPVAISGDTLAQRKPHPEPLHEAGRRLGATRIVYVGDSEVDAETAQAAGVPFLLFTEGYRKAPIAALPHTATFSHFSELPALVARVLAG
jgi:phosphoglycolate phosphatase